MLKNTLLFYDIETTGLNKCFDQVLQFAAIRTDLDLNTLSEHEIYIKLNSDVVPSPQAILTHQIDWATMQQGENEYEAIQKIHALLNQPGTLSLGYNTLKFDDEFLRFSFYRNLLNPYSHQYANQCGRLDLYPMTVLYYLFSHHSLNWPMIDGKISLKLEHISAANHLMTGAAHNAMVDVKATLNLAKRLKKETKMWAYTCGYFDKNTDIKRGDSLPIAFETDDKLFREGLIVNGKIGSQHNFMIPVLSLGQHHHYKNQTLWLHLDHPLLQSVTPDTIAQTTQVTRKKMGEGEFLLAPETRYVTHLSQERQTQALQNKHYLLSHPQLLQAICEYHQSYKYPDVPHVDIDAALYSIGFATALEEKLFKEFHQAAPQDKLKVALKFAHSPRYEQALRILARHYPQYLSAAERADFADYQQAKTVDFRGTPKLTRAMLQQELQTLSTTELSDRQRALLADLHTG